MSEDKKKTASGKDSAEREKVDSHDVGASEDACRCKEVSRKSLPELIKLMLGDFTFWKKRGR
jgi:hypothetical protein